MPTPKFDRDRAARILIDALTIGDVQACQKWSITRQSLYNYRSRMKGDSELLQAMEQKKAMQDQEWADEIPSMLKAGLEFLKRAATEADCKDPAVIREVAIAVKFCAETYMMRQLIEARVQR
ncbi:hypothetical protein H6F89_28505 [Cyanobacteria bacterium FACHB-63]|nr:hypothetical protein [Cyanobacteria bacterium FACHB-63]